MTTITTPAFTAISSYELTLQRADVGLKFMNGAEVIYAPNIAFWILSAPLAVMNAADARAWMAALVQLSKFGNTFDFTPPDYNSGPSGGYAGANPLVNGASQVGTSLICNGVSNNTLIVSAGDYLEVNNEFKMVTANATSNGSGAVTIFFEPALRQSPANGATVQVQTPAVTMRLINPSATQAVRPKDLYNFSLEAVETYGP